MCFVFDISIRIFDFNIFLACNGDSGGAVVVFDSETKSPIQVGIVSWGKDCAEPRFPGVNARILAEREWIREHTGI